MPRLLFIAPYFPPVGVVGAKRPLMLARHLPAFGWEPVVLAADPAGERADPSLLEGVPPDLEVARRYRAPFSRPPAAGSGVSAGPRATILGWDPGNFTPLDRYLWGTPAAVRAGLELVDRHRAKAVLVSADPWSGLLAGARVARARQLPLVADLRDPWSLQQAKMRLTPPPVRGMIRAIERWVFRRAAAVVLNTEAARDAYVEAYRGVVPAGRFHAIRNAFDPGLFHAATPVPSARWTVVHFGHFRRLVPAEPLLEGFARFVALAGLAPDSARLLVVGSLPRAAVARAAGLGLEPYLEVRPPVPYAESLAVLGSADAVALVATGGMALTVPAKLYDYLAAGRPILAVTDQPEPARLVADAGLGEVAAPGKPEEIARALVRLRARTSGPGRGALDPAKLRAFSAPEQARAMAAVLDAALSGGAPQAG